MSLFTQSIVGKCKEVFDDLALLPDDARMEAVNAIRLELRKHSPLAAEPVDCVLWVPFERVHANDYNPNSVAPPEMKLLAHSITEDGYTQPIVAWENAGKFEVVDGYHRNRVGREIPAVRDRVKGYLPITVINAMRTDREDRIAATIRHNRARGKHRIDAMSEIVAELKRRNWSDEKIGRDLGMDPDEVLRLTQISGLAEMFADREFSQAWEVEEATEINEGDTLATHEENLSPLSAVGGLANGDVPGDPVPDTSISDRRGGETTQCSQLLMAMRRVLREWPVASEVNLSNQARNRQAWLGQSACFLTLTVPDYLTKLAWHTLSLNQQVAANDVADSVIEEWINAQAEEP